MLSVKSPKTRAKPLIPVKDPYKYGEGSFTSQVLIYLDFVWFNKLCIGIDIVDILVSQRHPVAPVQ